MALGHVIPQLPKVPMKVLNIIWCWYISQVAYQNILRYPMWCRSYNVRTYIAKIAYFLQIFPILLIWYIWYCQFLIPQTINRYRCLYLTLVSSREVWLFWWLLGINFLSTFWIMGIQHLCLCLPICWQKRGNSWTYKKKPYYK